MYSFIVLGAKIYIFIECLRKNYYLFVKKKNQKNI